MENSEKELGENWWIDYLENEVTLVKRDQMEMLLRFSTTDRLILKNLETLKKIVRSAEPKPPQEPSYYLGLHAKIMNAVKKSKKAAKQKSTSAKTSQVVASATRSS